jgi:hypothetical protein
MKAMEGIQVGYREIHGRYRKIRGDTSRSGRDTEDPREIQSDSWEFKRRYSKVRARYSIRGNRGRSRMEDSEKREED